MTGCFASVGRSAFFNLSSIRSVPFGKVVGQRQRIECKFLRFMRSKFDNVLAFCRLIASSRESGNPSCKLSETVLKHSCCTYSTVECNAFSRYIAFWRGLSNYCFLAFAITNSTKTAR